MNPTWERAAKAGDATALSAQLSTGAPKDALDRFGQTALMLAAIRGHVEACQVLIDADADLDVTAKYGLSALMLAVINGHEAVARILAAAGADLAIRGVGAPGFFDKTACDLARENGLFGLADELSHPSRSD